MWFQILILILGFPQNFVKMFIIPAAVAVPVTEDNRGQDDNKQTERENHSGCHDTIFLGKHFRNKGLTDWIGLDLLH